MIDSIPSESQHSGYSAIAITSIFSCQLHYLLSDFILVLQAYVLVSIAASVLTDNPACPSLAESICGDNFLHCGFSLGRAYIFPELISFSI